MSEYGYMQIRCYPGNSEELHVGVGFVLFELGAEAGHRYQIHLYGDELPWVRLCVPANAWAEFKEWLLSDGRPPADASPEQHFRSLQLFRQFLRDDFYLWDVRIIQSESFESALELLKRVYGSQDIEGARKAAETLPSAARYDDQYRGCYLAKLAHTSEPKFQ